MTYSFLIVTIPMVLSILTGFAIVFIFLPRWIIRRYHLSTRRKIAAGFALAGMLISFAFVAEYAVTRTEIVSRSVWVWPASIGLGALDPPGSASTVTVFLIWSLTILSNVGLYGWLGLLVGSVWGAAKGTRTAGHK